MKGLELGVYKPEWVPLHYDEYIIAISYGDQLYSRRAAKKNQNKTPGKTIQVTSPADFREFVSRIPDE